MEPNAFISSRLDYCNQLFVGVTGRMPDKPHSRTLLLAWSLEPENLTTLHL